MCGTGVGPGKPLSPDANHLFPSPLQAPDPGLPLNLNFTHPALMILTLLRWMISSFTNQYRRFWLPHLIQHAKTIYPPVYKGGGSVCRLSDGTVLKTGPAWQIRAEVDAMHLVASQTTIPIPRIYDIWFDGEKGFIVMEFIDGENLRRAFFTTLTEEQRCHVSRTLASYLEQLRLIPPPEKLGPPGWIGAANGGPFCEPCLSWKREPLGPFPSLSAFNDYRVSLYDKFGRIHPPIAVRLAELRHSMADNQRVVFTHADLHSDNVIIRVRGKGAEHVDVVAILDWGCAGWRPIFWEAFKVMWLSPRPGIWKEKLVDRLWAGMEMDNERELELSNPLASDPHIHVVLLAAFRPQAQPSEMLTLAEFCNVNILEA
ncbi:kinase-like protein, partial [Hymenopellis radicata]